MREAGGGASKTSGRGEPDDRTREQLEEKALSTELSEWSQIECEEASLKKEEEGEQLQEIAPASHRLLAFLESRAPAVLELDRSQR